jgi:hypothetical protein
MEKLYKVLIEWNNQKTGLFESRESLMVFNSMPFPNGKAISLKKMLVGIFGKEYLANNGWNWDRLEKSNTHTTYTEVID